MADRKVALITGITGQDGSYLSELLLEKGYEIHGIIRRSSSFNTKRIDHIFGKIHLHYGDMIDSSCLIGILNRVRPTEIYNLAAQSHVKVSFEIPEYTGDVDGLGTLRLLEAIRICGMASSVRFYQASTSELYGKVHEVPQTELTPFHPRSPYGVAKLYAYWLVVNYRESYSMFACNGVLFNHESPRRGGTFVTKKIVDSLTEVFAGRQEKIILGNLNSLRDWGHARDYVYAMWLMLQADKPEDFVIASGEQISVREFTSRCFFAAGKMIRWIGSGFQEEGVDENGKVLVSVSERYFRPAEVDTLLGDASKAKEKLNWMPTVSVNDLIIEMLQAQFDTAKVVLPSGAAEKLKKATDNGKKWLTEMPEFDRCLGM